MPQSNPRRNRTTQQSAVRGGSSSARPTRVSSVRIGDMPSVQGQSRTAVHGGVPLRIRIIIISVIVVVLGLLVGAAVLFNSDMFPVKQVNVTGATHLTSAEVTELAAVPSGSTLLKVDDAGICSRLESSAWVEKAEVRHNFPDTLELVVTERTIEAVASITSVTDSTAENWALASDGTWLMSIPDQGTPQAASVSAQVYTDAAAVLHITDIPYGINPVVGEICTDGSVLNALDIVAGLTTDLSNQVTVVSAADSDSTVLTLENGIQIAFGSAEDIREKERVCLQLMETYPDKIAYINVSVVDRPTWRAIS